MLPLPSLLMLLSHRLPLSQSSACMSLGMFLSLCFSAPGLEVFGRQLHSGFIRCGRHLCVLHTLMAELQALQGCAVAGHRF
jgi:hypothetical protein